eukprot:6753307-Pyramimonas_sp.AAC.1
MTTFSGPLAAAHVSLSSPTSTLSRVALQARSSAHELISWCQITLACCMIGSTVATKTGS